MLSHMELHPSGEPNRSLSSLLLSQTRDAQGHQDIQSVSHVIPQNIHPVSSHSLVHSQHKNSNVLLPMNGGLAGSAAHFLQVGHESNLSFGICIHKTVEPRSNGPAGNGNPPITEAIFQSHEKFFFIFYICNNRNPPITSVWSLEIR